jgi:Conjugal transfer protein TraD
MLDIEEQKLKLEQKKNRLVLEETRLRLKEQKMRTKNLIEIGGLVVKVGLDYLPMNTLYGALISLNDELKNNDSIKAAWTIKGNATLNKEKKDKAPVILKLKNEPSSDIRDFIRSCGLRFNRFRNEWCGMVTNLNNLKSELNNQSCEYKIEVIDSDKTFTE